MNQKSDIDAIRELAANSEKRTKMGRLRAIFHEIENAKAAGVSNSDIVDALNKQGYDLNLKTFESMIYRIRKERKNNPNNKPTMDAPRNNITPKDRVKNSLDHTQETKSTKEEKNEIKPNNPFAKKQTQDGDLRRTNFDYNPKPDKTKIYGDNNDE